MKSNLNKEISNWYRFIDLNGSKNRIFGVCNLQSCIIKSKLNISSGNMYFLYIEMRLSLKVAYLADMTTQRMANPYQRKATSVNVMTLSLHTKYPMAPMAYAIQRNNCT